MKMYFLRRMEFFPIPMFSLPEASISMRFCGPFEEITNRVKHNIFVFFISFSEFLEVFLGRFFLQIDSESACFAFDVSVQFPPGHQVLDLQVPGATQRTNHT